MRFRLLSITVIIAVMLILLHQCDYSFGGRAKRFIAFRKGTTFFYRLNYKIASIETSTIFAQATGFKVAWKMPSRDAGSRKRRNIDEFHESAALVYESHGFDGKACLAKNICQALAYARGRDGVMMKILRLLANETSLNGATSRFDMLACREYSLRCPLDLLGINNFVDYS